MRSTAMSPTTARCRRSEASRPMARSSRSRACRRRISHQVAFRAALRERAVLTARTLSAIPGFSCVEPQAAFYAMPKVDLPAGVTDQQYVIGLVRATGVLCVHGSGFGTRPEDGYFRVVFLAAPAELAAIFADIEGFTRDFLAGH